MTRDYGFRVPVVLFALTLFTAFLLWPTGNLCAQSITTGSITGIVTDGQKPVRSAGILAVHEPSGTTYTAITRTDGRFSIPNMRVGGPYTVTAAYVGTGTAFEPKVLGQITVNLSVATDVSLNVQAIKVSEEITVTGKTDTVFAANRTGAATTLSRDELASLPTRMVSNSPLTNPSADANGKWTTRSNRHRASATCTRS